MGKIISNRRESFAIDVRYIEMMSFDVALVTRSFNLLVYEGRD